MAEKKGKATEIVEMAPELVKASIRKPFESVIGVTREKGGGWKLLVEVLERKAIPDTQDLIGRYELLVSDDGELDGYNQVRVRRRSDREGVEFMT